MLPGGKGINIDRAETLELSTALGFPGRLYRKEIAGRLDQMGIKNGCICGWKKDIPHQRQIKEH